MTNNRHIPKRRFPSFEGEWEEKKLGELSNIVRGASPRPIQDPKWFDEKSEIGWLRISDVSEQDGRIYKLEQRLSELGQQKTRVVHEPHLLMSIAATVGKPVINYVKTGVHDGFLIFLEPKFNLEYMFKWLEMHKNQWKRYGQPGSQLNLNSDIVKNQTIFLPECNEQVAIGSFFHLLDQSITLHQHKLDKLKNLKKAYLAELFPAEGERLPKRRFPGFEGEWEEKKLASIASMHARIGWQNLRTSEFLDHGDYYLITGTDFLDGHINFDKCHYVDEKRFQQDKNIQVVNGSILITKDGTLGKVAIVNNLDKPATLNAGVFNVVVKDSNIDVKYLYQYLAAPYLMNYVSKRATGGTIKHLNQNILVDFPIYFPEYKEQKTIGNFLEKLDKSISLQQEKLDKLKDLKKAYLNELFV